MAMKYYDEEIERALLGCMIWSNGIIIDVANFLQPECFYLETNKRIFNAIVEMADKKMPVDIVALASKRCSEPGYIAELTDVVSSGANWEFYARKVKGYYIARELKRTSAELQEEIDNALKGGKIEDDVVTIADRFSKRSAEIADSVGASTRVKMLRDIMPLVCDRLDYAIKHPGELIGMDSGLRNLNHFTSGIQKELIVIGARPSIGKSALGVQLAMNMARKGNKGILFQLEMSDEAVAMRIVSNESGINNQLMKSGLIREGRILDKITGAMEMVGSWPFAIEDRIKEIHDMAARIRYLVRCEEYKWVMIDHFSKIQNRDSKKQRHEQYIEISNTLADLSHMLKIPIVLLAQLNRQVEGKEPSIADIGETKALEQDADTIMFIHREREENADSVDAELIIAKQRDGAIGRAKLVFFPGTTKFSDRAEDRFEKERQK
jgi:replicative DNA helicase